ncbi:MAG TPA: hypothetical protein VER58_21640 [Thermoanaerobaculia bacterium]|nr:hypothetical protein [Thermoanaerobaculia bacterium]
MRLSFGEFCFDTDRRELSSDGSVIHLTPKAVDLLRLLIDVSSVDNGSGASTFRVN